MGRSVVNDVGNNLSTALSILEFIKKKKRVVIDGWADELSKAFKGKAQRHIAAHQKAADKDLPSRRNEVQQTHAGFISDFFMARSKSQSPDKSDKKLEIEGEKFRAKLQV